MLIQLEIENFRSFNEKQTFTTVQRSIKRLADHVYEHESGLKILKTSGIYGTNGSGKTNLFKALFFLREIIKDSDFLNSLESNKYFQPFLLEKTKLTSPTKFCVDFIASNNKIYSYYITIDSQKKIILSEKLIRIDVERNVVIFTRLHESGKNIFEFPDKEEFKDIPQILYGVYIPSTSFLELQFIEDDDINAVRDWFLNKIEFLFPTYEFSDIAYIFTLKKEYLKLANDIIKIANVGIDKLDLAKFPIEIYLGLENKELIKYITSTLQSQSYHSFKDNLNNYCTAIKDEDGKIFIVKLICFHKDSSGELVSFDVDQESKGTIVLLHLIPALIRSYGEGINYFLDDINTSLHPILLKEILGQYLSLNLGDAKGQLIFNSHEDFLMDEKIIRQDELWLMEKKNGASIIFPLTDFPNVRFDLNLRKNYLNGKFGAVPFETEPEKIVFGE